MDTAMLIGSKFEQGTETEEPIFNPRTGETVLQMPEASLTQIEAAIHSAEKAFATWSRTTPAQRSAYLLRIADRIEDAACAAYEATVCAATRTEVIVTALVEATPRIREVAKSKAEARMAARLAKYN